ncbi:assimilatory sulfite reductase (NADPH) flavoprotein subunit [Thalassotalea euphylliae]|uniref:Sulfite reductase [NADPH] flavoprotein alpha-component n=1 Tax=Thalassotalea euphylliae TaxID=1655234 RepID=A0A3E0U2G5_9GAMM|nr:assimilatory sulfite reductase (NADPH) flavoprotein subunit [Thalassotalea euphylliae]REL30910.1 assimilatory sulfite reductase (NADPH) flavoprotein subunit [Thalassotalea euphylliae]
MLTNQQNSNPTSGAPASGTSALDANQLAQLQQLTQGYSPLQLAWASGYLAAKSEMSPVATAVAAATQTAVSQTLTVLYASQTGNAKGVATQVADAAKAAGIEVVLKNVADYKAKGLKTETHLLIVASTNGEGEPPDDAIEFHEFLNSKKAPKLDNLKYSVLALGDSSYEFFCQTGKDFDLRLAELGATRVADRVDCDVDYDADADAWRVSIVESLKDELTAPAAGLAPVVQLPGTQAPASIYTKQNPYAAELLVSQRITGRDSAKDVRHIEIDLGESGVTYRVGDALGVYFDNDQALVEELLAAVSLTGDETVELQKSGETLSLPIKQALVEQLEITQTPLAFVEFWVQHSGDEQLAEKVVDKNTLREFAANHQVVDVIKAAPTAIEAQLLADNLRKITPRLYSIASSQAEVDEEVHLTIGVVNYSFNDNERVGGASGFLGRRLEEGGQVRVFVEHNDNFRLPENPETPVIMIGPGTGVAPFRAFMQEREANDASGDNWMFFGDQTFTQDFLYQVEWQNYLKSGLLTKMDVAFSRDQAEKVYVQHRLKENAAEVFAWLERGAHLYVCGDANRMAKDVHNALVEIVAEQSGKTAEQAEEYLTTLRKGKRYQKDVY